MPAVSAPTVVKYDSLTKVATFRGGSTVNVVNATKVELMAVAKYLGIRFVGKPTMHFPVEAIRNAIYDGTRVVRYADSAKFATPKVSVPRPTVTMPQPKVAPVVTDSVAVNDAVTNLVRQIMSAAPSSMDVSSVTNLVNDIVAPKFATLQDTIRSTAIAGQTVATTVSSLDKRVDNAARELCVLSEKLDKMTPKVIEVHIPNRPVKKIDGIQHEQFPSVLRILSKNRNLFLVGPAGTGKTTIAENAAMALGAEFSAQSFNAQSSKADLVGFVTANGVYVPTEFRRRFENGGIYLMDEIDNANPNILGTLNAALANGYMAFPDGMVKRHPEFVAIAAGNTYGNGATAQYVGRNPIDAATKDRFVFMDILIDENVENAMVGATGLDAAKAAEWLNVVRQCRKNVAVSGLQIIVSPRAAENGAHLIDAGFSVREVVDMTILKGAKPDQAAKVLDGVTL